jgi:hypothetical protein
VLASAADLPAPACQLKQQQRWRSNSTEDRSEPEANEHHNIAMRRVHFRSFGSFFTKNFLELFRVDLFGVWIIRPTRLLMSDSRCRTPHVQPSVRQWEGWWS